MPMLSLKGKPSARCRSCTVTARRNRGIIPLNSSSGREDYLGEAIGSAWSLIRQLRGVNGSGVEKRVRRGRTLSSIATYERMTSAAEA
jgi:hypothetical protein